MLTYTKRQELWEWCRNFIDNEAIYHADATHPTLPSQNPKVRYSFQFYLRRATYNAQFAHAIGLLFWDHFLPVYQQQAFQICATEPSGTPIALAIQNTAPVYINIFSARREPKSYGMDNWFNGRVIDLPILMVDDIAASAPHLLRASIRVQQKLGLPLHQNYFCLVNKVGPGISKEHQHTENYLDGQLISLFTFNNFSRTAEDYAWKHSHRQEWTGLIK